MHATHIHQLYTMQKHTHAYLYGIVNTRIKVSDKKHGGVVIKEHGELSN